MAPLGGIMKWRLPLSPKLARKLDTDDFLFRKKNLVFNVINLNLFATKQYIVKLTLCITRSLVDKLQINIKLLRTTAELLSAAFYSGLQQQPSEIFNTEKKIVLNLALVEKRFKTLWNLVVICV